MKRRPMAREVEGFVLAGGRSRRMGEDKALLQFEGEPMIVRSLGKLSAVTGSPRIVGDRSDLAPYAQVVPDLQSGSGPLGGICGALQATACEWNVFLAVDLPLLPAGFLCWMVRRVALTGALATVPLLAGVPQPLAAVYHRALLPELQCRLLGKELKTAIAIAEAASETAWPFAPADYFHVETVAAAGQLSSIETKVPVNRWFENLNSRMDFDCCFMPR